VIYSDFISGGGSKEMMSCVMALRWLKRWMKQQGKKRR